MESLAVCILMLVAMSSAQVILVNHTYEGQTSILKSTDYPEAPPIGTSQEWVLSAAEGCKIHLECPRIIITKAVGCIAGSLSIVDEPPIDIICEGRENYKYVSAGRVLIVQFSTGVPLSAKFECAATSVPTAPRKKPTPPSKKRPGRPR